MSYKEEIKSICKQFRCNAATASILWKLHQLYQEMKDIEKEEQKDAKRS